MAGGGSVWVAASGAIFRIDPTTNRVTATAPVGSGAGCLGLTSKDVWVADPDDGTVTRLGG
jgi:DNA-binding beta-propeller fold protein YncE